MKLCRIYNGRGSHRTEKLKTKNQEILKSKRTSIITPPNWAKIETLEAYRHKFAEVEGPYSYYRRILTKSELIQLNLPDPNLCGVNLKSGCKYAIDTVVKLLQNGKYNELKDLFADRPLSKARDLLVRVLLFKYHPYDMGHITFSLGRFEHSVDLISKQTTMKLFTIGKTIISPRTKR